MREILFRGKDINDEEWVYGSLVNAEYSIIIPQDAEWCGGAEFNAGYKVDCKTVGQYIGLKDRNGVRIFEGDILRLYSTYQEELVGKPCAVAYGVFNCSCCGGVYGWEFNNMGDIRDVDDYEVIGNIHDNPELIKAGE